MSHELRTPLNSLLLLARLLADNPDQNLTGRQTEFARTIHSAGTDLLRLIDDILDLSKIEAGRMDVEPGETSFDELCAYVRQAFGPQAEEKGLRLSVLLDPSLPASIITDGPRLQQILRNLLSNAVKFTASGSVTLAIRPADPTTASTVEAVAFTVTDTGIGIADDKLSLIFEAFQQADGTTSRRYGGTGLGLSISRELARLLGGAISVSSTVGGGSTFTLVLPDLAPSQPSGQSTVVSRSVMDPTPVPASGSGPSASVPAPRARQLPAGAAVLRGATVLIVDDDVRNVFALTTALEMHGMTVLYADNGADGLRLLAEHVDIDIVLMDAMMPEMDGYETTEAIRRDRRFAELPIVFLTAKAMPGDRESSLAAGASDYITKPVDLDDLLTLMARWVTGAAETVR